MYTSSVSQALPTHHLVLITGPSQGGLGAETAFSLAAASPALIILAGRSLSKIQPVIDEIKSLHPTVATRFISLDLGSQVSVRESAVIINASVEKIDYLINNAAIMSCPFSKTVDGIESQFGTNHIGHFLLTNLILGKILAAGEGARIVNVSSSAHNQSDVRFDDWNFEVRVDKADPYIGLCPEEKEEAEKQILTNVIRMAKAIRHGRVTARPKRPTFCSVWRWPEGLKATTSKASPCIPAVSPHTSTLTLLVSLHSKTTPSNKPHSAIRTNLQVHMTPELRQVAISHNEKLSGRLSPLPLSRSTPPEIT